MIYPVFPSDVELQTNKGQPNGYLGLDSNGDAVGILVGRVITYADLSTTSLEQGEWCYISDTKVAVVGNSTTPGDYFPMQKKEVAVALTDAATIATDASLGSYFTVTLQGNRTLGNPTNMMDGQKVTWRFLQDAAGTRTITLDTAFRLGTDLTSVSIGTGANKASYLSARYHLADAKWDVVELVRGF